MSTLFCGRCAVTDLQVFVNHILTDPPGWGCVTTTGTPIRNVRLCPSCLNLLHRFLNSASLWEAIS